MESIEAKLSQGEFFRFERNRRALRCLSGSAWITYSGESTDFLLVPGKDFNLRGKKKVCVQAMESSSLVCL